MLMRTDLLFRAASFMKVDPQSLLTLDNEKENHNGLQGNA